MSKYDDLFEETAPDNSVFTDKGALDPLAEPDEIMARDEQERELATILNGVSEGYLPPTVSIHGPPGAGKTLTARRIAEEFAARREELTVEYVNLKECRTIFSAANEIHLELTGDRKKSYEGLDGVFEGIWVALEEYPEYTVLILDEIDQLQHDTNYDPNEFFYRLLRGEGKLKRGISLSAWLISNQLVEVDLRLDSRVESTMGNEEVFFGPYNAGQLTHILTPRIQRAFTDEAYVTDAVRHGIIQAAIRWGDARKGLTLFRTAGELANERGLATLTKECIDDSLEETEEKAVMAKLTQLPANHVIVLAAMTGWRGNRTGEIVQPVSTAKIRESIENMSNFGTSLGTRSIRKVVTDLETMGLVETWIESRGDDGRVKQHKTTFDPRLGQEIMKQHPNFGQRGATSEKEDTVNGDGTSGPS